MRGFPGLRHVVEACPRACDRGVSSVEYALLISALMTGSVGRLDLLEDTVDQYYRDTASEVGNPNLDDFAPPAVDDGAPTTTTTTTTVATTTPTTAPTPTTTTTTTTVAQDDESTTVKFKDKSNRVRKGQGPDRVPR